MLCLGKCSFMVLFLLENIFLDFLKEHMTDVTPTKFKEKLNLK